MNFKRAALKGLVIGLDMSIRASIIGILVLLLDLQNIEYSSGIETIFTIYILIPILYWVKEYLD